MKGQPATSSEGIPFPVAIPSVQTERQGLLLLPERASKQGSAFMTQRGHRNSTPGLRPKGHSELDKILGYKHQRSRG